MHVIEPARYMSRPTRRSKRPMFGALVLFLVVVGGINYLRPLPEPVASLSITVPSSVSTPAIEWPASGQASVAAAGYGVLGTSGMQTPLATASIAKVITALCVLQKQPLDVGQSGPTYTVSASDVAIYNNYVNLDGSVVAVTQGEKLTERQALEALLLPSANNVADSLVNWVFGSHADYATYANLYLAQHGLTATIIGADASGFDPSTTSTASDLAGLGLLALQSPILMSIAGEKTTTLPVVGTVANYDTVLGQNGITGLKTGNNDADPGAFLFTATSRVGGKDLLLTGSVMGASDLATALSDSSQLVSSLAQGFEPLTIAQTGQQVGKLQTKWGASDAILSNQALQIVRWKATPLTATHQVDTSLRSGTIGSIKIAAGQAKSTTTLRLQHTLAGPSLWWRLTRH